MIGETSNTAFAVNIPAWGILLADAGGRRHSAERVQLVGPWRVANGGSGSGGRAGGTGGAAAGSAGAGGSGSGSGRAAMERPERAGRGQSMRAAARAARPTRGAAPIPTCAACCCATKRSRWSATSISATRQRMARHRSYGRDMQLVGGRRFLIGPTTVTKAAARRRVAGHLSANFAGNLGATGWCNGNTILCGENWQGGTESVLVEVNAAGVVQAHHPASLGLHLRTPRPADTDGHVPGHGRRRGAGGRRHGHIFRRVNVTRVNPAVSSHVWQALRIPTGELVVSTGYRASIQNSAPTGRSTRPSPDLQHHSATSSSVLKSCQTATPWSRIGRGTGRGRGRAVARV